MESRVTDFGDSSLAPSTSHGKTYLWWTRVCAVFAFLLYLFPPEMYPFYPPCPVYQLTGLLCPGCGATRAVAALLHGHLRQALDYNAMVILLFPVLAAWLVLSWRAGRLHPLSPPLRTILFAFTAVFTISRNIHTF